MTKLCLRTTGNTFLNAIVTLAATAMLAASAQAQPLKALMLTSPGVYHDYNAQMHSIGKALAERVSVTMDVSLAETERWQTSDFGLDYDVILYNICMADETDATLIANLRRQTETLGVPAIVLHCTMHSFRNTEQWWPLYGLKTVAHESLGKIAQLPAGKHPILHGIPSNWQLENDELYINLVYDAQTLLTATGEDGKQHVTAWVKSINDTRIFGTTLGHSLDTLEDPHFAQLLANGLLWVTGNLLNDGTPRPGLKPTATGSALGEISAAPGVTFSTEEERSCMQKEIFWAIGPCYLGCTINPLIWGEDAAACKENCIAQIPGSPVLIKQCSGLAND